MRGSKGMQQRPQVASSHQPNRLNKTQHQPGKGQYLDNYQGKKVNMTQKNIPSEKSAFTMPPRTGSTQKINYKVADNMTNSKIMEAKQGLQLLKKKMSRNGMSRDKNERGSMEKRQPQIKKTIAKQEDYYGYEQQAKKTTPQIPQKRQQRQPINTKKSPPIPTKSATIEQRPIKRQPQNQEYINPAEQAPLNSNKDFMAILQRQMAKENASKQPQPMARGPTKPMSLQEDEEIQLAQCSKGCGRQFNVNVIQKHEKVCQKVFQSKRKVFNSASHRAPEVQDFKMPPPPSTIHQKPSTKTQKAKEQKIPKWKQQSAAFRAGLKQGRGQQLTAEEKATAEKATGMVQCGCCGRKFNEDAAKRHIPFCQSKAKQMPKMNTSKRR